VAGVVCALKSDNVFHTVQIANWVINMSTGTLLMMHWFVSHCLMYFGCT